MSGECVKVVVRCRPMNQREKDLNCQVIVNMDTARNQVMLSCSDEPKAPPKQFTFDGAYYLDSLTETLYTDVGFPLVESVCEGYNGTVFAYGQTGCGKSFTMQGIKDNLPQKGIIPRAFEHIFEAVATDTTKKFLIRASYLEIYNENIRDLLGKDFKQTLEMHETPEKGVYVTDLSMHECKKVSDCEKLMDKGNKNRSTGATLMNADSSRSHSIFAISVEMCEKDDQGKEHYRVGKLNLVDLAGSERQAKTGATGDRLKEATKINLSLSALGNVISALVDGKSKHIPYRDSKLTRLLQDSLGGNTKTLMIAAISPAGDNYEETLSTLRYANRAKNIKNKPTINEDPKDAKLRQLQDEINLLRAQLAGKVPVSAELVANKTKSPSLDEEKYKLRMEYERQIAEINSKYEEEKMSKEALSKEIESIKDQYDRKMSILSESDPNSDFIAVENLQPQPLTRAKSARGNRKGSATMKRMMMNENQAAAAGGGGEVDDLADTNDPALRLLKMEEMIVGGEQANNEELKRKRSKTKRMAEERRRQLAESIKNNDDEFMLQVYNSVQEEVKYKTKLFEREKERNSFLQNEVKDLQKEFEQDREEYLDTIRKQGRHVKLLTKILYKIQPIISNECNYYNLDRIQANSIWNEEHEDWTIPELKIEKLSLPAMSDIGHGGGGGGGNSNGGGEYYSNGGGGEVEEFQVTEIPKQPGLLQARRGTAGLNRESTFMVREPEVDRYRMKLENSQFDGSSYFKTKRQSQLLNQTQDIRNGRLSPMSGQTNGGVNQRGRRPF